jgi:uncharacterized membrane protein YhhN
MIPAAFVVTVLALGALLAAEKSDHQRLRWFAKPIASTGFVAFGLLQGALDTRFGTLVLVALVLSWWGDVLLIPKNKKAFLAGIAAFGLGHLGFAASFLVMGVDPGATAVAAAVMAVPAFFLGRLFIRSAPEALKGAVGGYIGVITAMVALAAGVVRAGGDPTVLVAAVVFYASDISVTRDRFVKQSFINKAWGLPAYYGSQLLFGLAIGHAAA